MRSETEWGFDGMMEKGNGKDESHELRRWKESVVRDGVDKLRFGVGITCSVLIRVLHNCQLRVVIGRSSSKMDRHFRRSKVAGTTERGELFLSMMPGY